MNHNEISNVIMEVAREGEPGFMLRAYLRLQTHGLSPDRAMQELTKFVDEIILLKARQSA